MPKKHHNHNFDFAKKHAWITYFCAFLLTIGTVWYGFHTQASLTREMRRLGRISMRPAASRITRSTTVSGSVPFECAISPFGFVPHWGNMNSHQQLGRKFTSISPEEYIAPPAYAMDTLTRPLSELNRSPRTEDKKKAITAKLFYSTRFMGSYDLDSAEYVNPQHPGIDMKMPHGTPVRSIAGGVVHALQKYPKGLGDVVIVEHRLPRSGEKIYSIYGHMDKRLVQKGQRVAVGQVIGTVGNSGRSTTAHLHLQIDKDRSLDVHSPYVPSASATRSSVEKWTVHPMEFISQY